MAMEWDKLKFDPNTDVANNFSEVIANPIQEFCGKSLDIVAVIGGLLLVHKTMGDKVADMYSKRLYGNKTLDDLPTPGKGPEFIFYASSLQTGAGVRISKNYLRDYKVGEIPNPGLPIAKVVSASSAFPPFFCYPDVGVLILVGIIAKAAVAGGAGLFDNIDGQ